MSVRITIAPTGSISTMWNISGGIEPIFAKYYTRTTKSLHGKDVTYKIHPPLVEQYLQEHNCTFQDIPDYFITSDQLHWKNRIDMQAALQENIDASISSTLNLKEDVTLEDVKQLYIYAWKIIWFQSERDNSPYRNYGGHHHISYNVIYSRSQSGNVRRT